ncbi:hypothetical protein NHF50_08915 [Flavobacterium sp. NRK F10]|uniref:hypothetical protein n=1 Tax=Flavobacterium sp. NRK F10 TaxID=2954931 RepID=UPI002091E17B|nr:hypothetical protein [Flavobacterium sp. NRK F10]MCO6175168.1 hypothetical protein [Flavobacterium sp. NRK F10]
MQFKTCKISEIIDLYPKLFESLRKYYPFEITKDKKDYYNFNGLKLLNSIIETNIISEQQFHDKWVKGFLDKIHNSTNYKIIGATYGIVPNIGGRIILEENQDHTLELHFFVSLIENYYSIQIVKICEIQYYNSYLKIIKSGKGLKEIYVSPPDNKYGELFNKIDNFICSELNGAKFLPFRFDLVRIENFQVFYKDTIDYSTISDCFFHKGFLYDKDCSIFGDIDYKISYLK